MIDEEEEEGERSTTQQQTQAKPGPREIGRHFVYGFRSGEVRLSITCLICLDYACRSGKMSSVFIQHTGIGSISYLYQNKWAQTVKA